MVWLTMRTTAHVISDPPITYSQGDKLLAKWGFVGVSLFLGLGFRLAPLFDRGGRLLRQWPTEDGYLMLTIARNIGIGNGMTTAAGTIPTNGTQPLCTLLWAALYSPVDGDKTTGVVLVLIASVAISAAAAYLVYRLGSTAFSEWPENRLIAAVAAGLWFVSPNSARHTMNCLETGLVAAFLVGCVWFFVATWRLHAVWSFGRCVLLGGLLGITFWARVDACLFIGAACLVRVLYGLPAPRLGALRRRLLEAVAIGATSVLVASPWLIHNQIHFGSN